MNDMTNAGVVPESQTEQMPRPGELIRMRREAAGMTQAQVGETLHLTLHYIRALENDEYRKLPGLTFVKGYFRAYARLLKIDENEVLECYDRYVATLDLPEASQPQTLHVPRRGDQAVSWALVTGLLLVAGLGTGWWFFGRDADAPASTIIGFPLRTPATVTAAAPPAPAPATPVQTTQSAAVPAPAASVQQFTSPPSAAPGDTPGGTSSVAGLPQQDASATEAVGATDFAATQSVATDLVQGSAQVPAEAGAAGTAPASVAPPGVAPEPTDIGESSDVAAPAGEAPADAASAAAGSRRVELLGNGSDRLQLQFSASSWVEVDDAARVRLYSGMMNGGDLLSIRATAPFHVLLGNARGVVVELNEAPLAIESSVRDDNTARVRISSEGLSPWVVQ